MEQIPTFERFNHNIFVKETYELVKEHMSYNEVSELLNEGFFDFIKGMFSNPLQKRKLDKLGQDLLKTKIELMKLEIEEDSIDSFKAQLDTMKRGQTDYENASANVDIADKAKESKIKSLQDRESILVDQMDLIGSESEKLQKYVDKVKFEIRIKANDATIRTADREIQRVLKDLKTKDMKAARDLDKEINKI